MKLKIKGQNADFEIDDYLSENLWIQDETDHNYSYLMLMIKVKLNVTYDGGHLKKMKFFLFL